MKIGNYNFELGKQTYVMGILNVTPDSFSDGGTHDSVEKAVRHARKMILDGADIIDVGGESTRPGHTPVDEREELFRILPVLKALKEVDIPVSIDTYKAAVAEAAIKEGAVLVNDIWGFKKDSAMADVCAKYGVTCCLMHNRDNKEYQHFLPEVLRDLEQSIDIALKAGVRSENIMIDPGVGFAKTYEQNLSIIKNLDKLTSLGYPILLGTSRKGMIGNTIHLPADQRVEGTIATTVIGIMNHCDFVRVHDVKENKRACLMADKILRG